MTTLYDTLHALCHYIYLFYFSTLGYQAIHVLLFYTSILHFFKNEATIYTLQPAPQAGRLGYNGDFGLLNTLILFSFIQYAMLCMHASMHFGRARE
jgi:hypothetical protein